MSRFFSLGWKFKVPRPPPYVKKIMKISYSRCGYYLLYSFDRYWETSPKLFIANALFLVKRPPELFRKVGLKENILLIIGLN